MSRYIISMGYAYPHSPKAGEMGRGDTGTWYVLVDDGGETPEHIPMDNAYDAVRHTYHYDRSDDALAAAITTARNHLTPSQSLHAVMHLTRSRGSIDKDTSPPA